MPAARIAEVVFSDPDTVQDVIHNFNRDGFEALYPRYRGGRPRTFTLPQRQAIKRIALGVLLIASPELSEVFKRAARYIGRWLTLAVVTFRAWRAFRKASRIEDPIQRTNANVAISLALMISALQDNLREDERQVVPAEDRKSLKKLSEYVAELERRLKEESARNAERVFGRHLSLRLLGVSLVVAGPVTSLVGHLQSIQSEHNEVVVTTTEIVVTSC